MKRIILIWLAIFLLNSITSAESPYPVRGLCISAPSPDIVEEFTKFIKNELAPAGLNLLILRVDYGYNYKSHPELAGDNPLTRQDIKKLVEVCKNNHIRIIPQINLLGHQSWHGTVGKHQKLNFLNNMNGQILTDYIARVTAHFIPKYIM
jgi:hypothetical protein